MSTTTTTDRAEAESKSGLSAIVLEYCETFGRLVEESKRPGFSVDDWAPLSELVAVDEFERVGNYREVMTWRDYIEAVDAWAPLAKHEHIFRRISELPGLVFLELEEHNTTNGHLTVINSVSVYEFNDAGKLRHLDIYPQMTPPTGNEGNETQAWSPAAVE